ncbi:hypothetical protein MHUMG1_07876 [Metarhizium humberi]|uniref:Protein kinase domain-containing protein n=1 Tax=Metarhizium humberi TaxID=2596975 RepID=A0A9P8M5L9_9HYPO|nr:hypothetical protein MHUMG1_07876 [Metarhizium humberi]
MSANVLDARLETQFLDGRVKHIRNVPEWRKTNSHASVAPDSPSQVRAVKIALRLSTPANIAVASASPPWRVEFADFGISKQAQYGAQLHTADVGALGYTAPETQSCQGTNITLTPYSFAVDIWAIVVIAL